MSQGTIAIRLDTDTRAKLEILAKATGNSRSFIVAEAVRLLVDAEYEALLDQVSYEGMDVGMSEDFKPERWNVIV